jgi:hypothetical protein
MPLLSTVGALTYNKLSKTDLYPNYRWLGLVTTSPPVLTAGNQGVGVALTSTNDIVYGAVVNNSFIYSSYLMKFAPAGTNSFQNKMTYGSDSRTNDVCVDSNDNVYTTGYSYISGYKAISVIKYNSSGVVQWQKLFYVADFSYDQRGIQILADSNNDICILSTITVSTTYARTTVIKINSSGTILWQNQIYSGTDYFQTYPRFSMDASNDLYICGRQNAAGNFIIKLYSNNGFQVWQKTSSFTNINDIVVDKLNNCFYTIGTIAGGAFYTYICKHNLDSTIQWTRYMVRGASETVYCSAIDEFGNLYVVDGDGDNNATGNNIYQIDSNGNLIWQNNLKTVGSDQMRVTALKVRNNSMYICGTITLFTHISKIPTNGRIYGTGTYTPTGATIIYSTTSRSFSIQSDPTLSNSSYTIASSSLTAASGLMTQSNTTQTISTIQI